MIRNRMLVLSLVGLISGIPGAHAGFFSDMFGSGDTAPATDAGNAPPPAAAPAPVVAPVVVQAVGDAAVTSGAAQLSPADVGIPSAPKTVWVPWHYQQDRQSRLYINGNLYEAPGGYIDVLGFIPAEYGYLVAVYQPRGNAPTPLATAGGGMLLTAESLAKMTPEQQIAALQAQMQIMQMGAVAAAPVAAQARNSPVVVLYKVSSAGQTLGMVAEVPTNDAKAWITPDTIYVTKHSKTVDIVGYTAAGVRVEGPQGVIDAVIAPNGDWLWSKYTYDKYSDFPPNVDTMRTTPAGVTTTEIGEGQYYMRNRVLRPAKQVFIDMPPVETTMTSGLALYSRTDMGNGPLKGPPLGTLFVRDLQNNTNTRLGAAPHTTSQDRMARAAILFGTPAKAFYVGQAQSSITPKKAYDVIALNPSEPVTGSYRVFNVKSEVGLFGHPSGSSFYEDYSTDVFGVTTSKTTVVVDARKWDARTLDLGTREPVNRDAMAAFITKYKLVSTYR